MHWLIVVPAYFFLALALFLTLAILCRIFRAPIGANALATAAVVLAVAAVAVPLALDWIDVAHIGGRHILALALVTLVAAALDTLLQPVLPVPADRDLAQL